MQFFFYLASWLRTRRFSEPFSTLRSLKLLEDKGIHSPLSHLFVHAVEFDKFGISETCYFSGILVLRDFMSTK